MRYLDWRFVIVLFLLPLLTKAACVDSGYTVVFVNGIFNTRVQADESRLALQDRLGSQFNKEPITVRLGYNPSHLAGAGDLLQAAVQGFGTSISDFDRDTILLQIYPEVTTRKLLFVGHSQGTFYTNSIYDYLLNHGEPKESIGVYNVATPANYVAGGGAYLTSSYDTIISAYAQSAKDFGWLPPLSPNIDLPLEAYSNGHKFVEVYLAQAGDRVVGDVRRGLSRLSAAGGTTDGGCYTPPEQGLAYKTQQITFAVADPLALGLRTGALTAYQGVVATAGFAAGALGSLSNFVGSTLSFLNPFTTIEPHTENVPGSFTVVKSIYGSSLNEADLQELLGTQGASVATAPPAPRPQQKVVGEVAGAETEHPIEPLIPPVSMPPLSSPGFGGGAASTPEGASTEISTTTSGSAEPSVPTTPISTTTPTVLAVSSDGATYTSATLSPVTIQITFDTDVSSTSVVVEGSTQVVNNCGDSDSKTACFDFALFATEPGLFERLTITAENSVGTSTDSSHRFIIDTLGPVVSISHINSKSALPTLTGNTSDASRPVQVFLNGQHYEALSSAGVWSLTIPAGFELAEGEYVVTASSTDALGNVGSTTAGTLTVDMTAPAVTLTEGPAEGGSVASSSPVAFAYTVTDSLSTAASCAFDADLFVTCAGSASASLAPGAHVFTVVANDAAGNSATVSRNFVVLP